jgi:hypothetical protein
MKKNLFLMLAITALGFSTMAQKNEKYKDNDKDRIEGSGNVIIKDIAVKSFDELNASGIFNLQLSQGDKEAVKIEAEDNLIDLFIVENEGSTLKISMKKNSNFNSKKKLKVYVTFKTLKSMDLSMFGGTSSDEKLKFAELKLKNNSFGSVDLNMTLQTLYFENESMGSVKLEGNADNAVVKNNSVGSINAGNFVVQKMEIDNTGIGSATVNAEKELKYSDSFLGKVSNRGSATVKRKNKVVI